jgi:hypothetical protein
MASCRGETLSANFTHCRWNGFPTCVFELDEVIERPSGVILIYRKLHVFTDHPGLTVEIFEMAADGLVKRNIVYWGSEEVSSRFRIKEI